MLKTVLLLSLLALPSLAQTTKCELTIDKAPALRGVRLRMLYGDVVKAFPLYSGLRDTIEVNGGKGDLAGVRDIKIDFIGDGVSKITVRYDDAAPKWNNDAEFASNVSASLGLSGYAWTRVSVLMSDVLICKDFMLRVSTYENSLSLSDTATILAANAATAAKQAATDEEKKKAFKP
jgi:hypothetical protein